MYISNITLHLTYLDESVQMNNRSSSRRGHDYVSLRQAKIFPGPKMKQEEYVAPAIVLDGTVVCQAKRGLEISRRIGSQIPPWRIPDIPAENGTLSGYKMTLCSGGRFWNHKRLVSHSDLQLVTNYSSKSMRLPAQVDGLKRTENARYVLL
jgi:hypothetical protein